MAAKKTSKGLRHGKKMGSVRPLKNIGEITLTKPTDTSSPS